MPCRLTSPLLSLLLGAAALLGGLSTTQAVAPSDATAAGLPGNTTDLQRGGGSNATLPALPTLHMLHPRNGSIVSSQRKVIVDIEIEDWESSWQNVSLCIRVTASAPPTAAASSPPSSTAWSCMSRPIDIYLQFPAEGNQTLEAAILQGRHEEAFQGEVQQLHAAGLLTLLVHDTVHFTAESREACVGSIGKPPCSLLRPHCTAFTRFKFYLYPSSSAPSSRAAELYYVLRDSPFRTLDPNEACFFIPLIDIQSANNLLESHFVSSKKLTRLPYWGRAGEHHLLFNYNDYGEE